jgi:23S rRNA (cytidine1920-2'-O)/16S rRNA (cytidine1409-2'-O)-methyltransferase
MPKLRLDELLVMRGFISSVEEAVPLIMAGKILIDDVPITTPGTNCDTKCRVRIKEKKSTFVSRGGDKIYDFIEKNKIEIEGKCCMDIGISTGGFTDALFRKHATHVVGVDVGYGILDYKLRKNKQLSLLERTNAREVTAGEINQALNSNALTVSDIELVVIDVSFISVFKILPNLMSFLNKSVNYIVLIKPQFEAEKHLVEAKGVIQSKTTLDHIIEKVTCQFLELDFKILAMSPSTLKGAKGNQEFFYYIRLC